MKKVILTVMCFVILSTSILISCSSNNASNSTKSDTNSSSSSDTSSKTFTVDELAKNNGQNGNPAYVAVNGKVYDVTNAKRWKNGKHENGIVAGVDLTNSLSKSPHGDKVLKDLPIVGQLK